MFPSVRSLAAAAVALLALPTLSAAETVKIGAAFSLTGNAAAYGAQQKAGVQAAIDDVNKSGKLKGDHARARSSRTTAPPRSRASRSSSASSTATR